MNDRLRRYAELAVRVGANVEPGQIVELTAFLEHAPLVREVTRCAYEEGAAFVDVLWIDQHVRKAMIELAPEDRLSWTPPWLLRRLEEHVARRAAHIAIAGAAEPDLMADLDPTRVGQARTRELNAANIRRINEHAVNWTLVACPTPGWAEIVLGEPDVERLWDAVACAVRLDSEDPRAAWDAHLATLDRRAEVLNERGFDTIRFRGPGTDLTVGLLPGSRWVSARAETTWGRRYVPNLPTEEVFTTPDPRRTEGVVRATRPLPLGGVVVRDLELRFVAGRAMEITAATGADAVRAHMASDEGSAYLGEIALVDGASRVGRTGLTFYEQLLDENAACHLAYGAGIPGCVEGDASAVNQSTVHIDFMVGGRSVEVDGILPGGAPVPLLREDAWQLR